VLSEEQIAEAAGMALDEIVRLGMEDKHRVCLPEIWHTT